MNYAISGNGTLDQDEIGRGSVSADVARRRDADEQPAPGSKQLFGYEYREGCTHRAAYDAHLAGAELQDLAAWLGLGEIRVGDRGDLAEALWRVRPAPARV